ncbi:CBS domain-containing protein [Streptomyces sp. NBC_00568]|uniref:CBS domain-containing protein n=1 Tax=Streptomyces sp. NBC_00568 TaxID=2975779 RepID=UPI00224C81D8|nr:CBS domain-containing protein [Streptomyces sp. NBC_00568]MCX4993126.1 CBS domain-containing protein [Streptomyces sp. NBC_00568]
MRSSPHRVGDVMTGAVVAVGRKALFKDIIERMERWQVSALPVLEGDGRVIGLVSEADLLPKEEFRDSDPDRVTQQRRLSDLAKAGAVSAEELMSTPAVTVHADATPRSYRLPSAWCVASRAWWASAVSSPRSARSESDSEPGFAGADSSVRVGPSRVARRCSSLSPPAVAGRARVASSVRTAVERRGAVRPLRRTAPGPNGPCSHPIGSSARRAVRVPLEPNSRNIVRGGRP